MSDTIVEVFKKPKQAHEALKELEVNGFTKNQISVLMSDETKGKSFNIEKNSKAEEGAAIGASVTGIVAAIATGIAALGSISISGLNLVAAGPLVAALAGAGVGAAAGGIIGGLIGLGVPEYEAKVYEKGIREGGILIAVEAKTDEEEETARNILNKNKDKNIAA